MRILAVGNMYPPHHLGGYELSWRSAMRHLRADGHLVRVLTTDYRHPTPDPAIAEEPDVFRELRWYWHDHEFPDMSRRAVVGLERHNAAVLARHLADFRPDAVNWWAMGGMSLSLIERVRRARIPAVGVVGDDWMHYGPQVDRWMSAVRGRGGVRSLAARALGIPATLDLSPVLWLFNSDRTLRSARETGFRLPHSEVAHPGVDDDLFREAPEHGWRWNLLYVGRIDERKGIDTAVEALALLPDARLTVLGSGDERVRDELAALCRRLEVEARVEFGQRPRHQLGAAYAAADALVFPARWDEPWGLVPLEAMAVGTPVVATGTGGSAEYLRDGENALVLGADATPEDFAHALERLAVDPGLRARLRRGGLATAARYTERGYNAAIGGALARVGAG